MEPMKALVIGATGAVGKDLVQMLLEDDSFEKVTVFVRRPVGFENPKLTVHIVDFDHPGQWNHLLAGDVLFSCLGTTIKHTNLLKSCIFVIFLFIILIEKI